MNVTYAELSETNKQLPEGTQPLIASYQVSGVADFAKKMQNEGEQCCTRERIKLEDWVIVGKLEIVRLLHHVTPYRPIDPLSGSGE